MRARIRVRERLFRAVCLGFSGFLLVLLLFWQIRLARTEARIEDLQTAILRAEDERARLTLLEEESLNLEVLEQTAVWRLGLQHPAQDQIFVLDNSG